MGKVFLRWQTCASLSLKERLCHSSHLISLHLNYWTEQFSWYEVSACELFFKRMQCRVSYRLLAKIFTGVPCAVDASKLSTVDDRRLMNATPMMHGCRTRRRHERDWTRRQPISAECASIACLLDIRSRDRFHGYWSRYTVIRRSRVREFAVHAAIRRVEFLADWVNPKSFAHDEYGSCEVARSWVVL